ncbi:hypothetical protein [Geodermatophilus sp. SYSU D01105]
METEQNGARPRDTAIEALSTLVTALDSCIDELRCARDRAEQLLAERRDGRRWLDIVTEERRPLVVEQISSVMSVLATVGGTWRREQAHALQSEQVSINRIATLFGVTRQRISALLRDRVAS